MTNPPVVPTAPNTDIHSIPVLFAHQQQHQYTVGRTTAQARIAKLHKLYDCILRQRTAIEQALWSDFRKSPTETNLSEMGVVLGEIRHVVRHLRSWMTPRSVGTPLAIFGSSTSIRYEPKGVCLIISPWNYPFNLTFSPLVSAIAAGNCCIVKPSEFTPHSSALMKSIVAECFPPEEVVVVEGDASVSQTLLDLPFNHIFFTGSPAVGKIVMAAAAKNLCSVTLELGGKSPVIVDASADLDNAAAKIAWTKAMNAGQICIAPDYLLVHESVHDALVQKIGEKLKQFYGTTPEARKTNPDLCRVVNQKHHARISSLINDATKRGATVSFGGQTDIADCYIEPTVLTKVPEDAVIWQEEIFGPVLPVRTWKSLDEVVAYIQHQPNALALYIFSNKQATINTILQETRSGGVAINDCAIHFYNANAPFGGVNNSGIGKTHGEFGFLEFVHSRTVLHQAKLLPTTNFMLPPYGGKLSKILIEAVVKWF